MMILDADKYRVNVPVVQSLLADKSAKERLKLISAVSVSTMCPVIVVAVYVEELFGYSEELDCLIIRLMRFYCIEAVTGRRSSTYADSELKGE